MKAAIDIDGTLTVWSRVLAPLTKDLTAAGWDVVLLTGTTAAEPLKADMVTCRAYRYAQVQPYGAAFRDIIVCVAVTAAEVGRIKAIYCRDNGIDLFIDNDPGYCAFARGISPATMVLHVV